MKYIIVFLFCFNSHVYGQHRGRKDSMVLYQVDTAKIARQMDSSKQMLDTFLNSTYKNMQSEENKRFQEQNDRNLQSFMTDMQDRQDREKRQMWIRIGLGLLFLAVGIYGVMRKRKKKE